MDGEALVTRAKVIGAPLVTVTQLDEARVVALCTAQFVAHAG